MVQQLIRQKKNSHPESLHTDSAPERKKKNLPGSVANSLGQL